MSHQTDILEILKTLDYGWHDTKEIHDALGSYWRDQRITIADSKTLQYTAHTLMRLHKSGKVEKKRVMGSRLTHWRVVE